MAEHIRVPIKEYDNKKWGALAYLAESHKICGERVDCLNARYTFVGGHRVALYRFKKNVYWEIPEGIPLDISAVPPAAIPQRRSQRQ
jgi:hypothetical protein